MMQRAKTPRVLAVRRGRKLVETLEYQASGNRHRRTTGHGNHWEREKYCAWETHWEHGNTKLKAPGKPGLVILLNAPFCPRIFNVLISSAWVIDFLRAYDT